jgi:quercetin dioxygenase-like cupin family protein
MANLLHDATRAPASPAMKPMHLPAKLSFSRERFLPQLIHGSERVRAFLLCLEPGQGLPARADSEEMLCCVLEGRGLLTIGDQTAEVSAGDFATAAAGEVRGIEAKERMAALWVHVSAAHE